MSPAKMSTDLQEDFVRTELETGLRMIARAKRQRSGRKADAALESLGLAKLALTGAEDHMAAVTLPDTVVGRMNERAGRLRQEIAAFEAGETPSPSAAH